MVVNQTIFGPWKVAVKPDAADEIYVKLLVNLKPAYKDFPLISVCQLNVCK